MPERLSILIVEDNAADRMLLSTIVSRQGHRVLTAGNGLEAVALFEQERPHLVLMDALMPVMDGFEAARRIKQQAGEALVPIIFLTSLTENEALVRCLEAGGDDFLAKPYNRVILEAKIGAMDRLRRLQATVLEQRDLIARHNEHLLREQRVAKAVFDKVAHSGCLDAPNIRYLQSPYALFNGDLLLAAYTPSGGMHVMLGDFTGHGLPAAIGAMPLAEVFYGMTSKGHALAEILREINAKLKRILPVGVFCCATLLNISSQRGLLEVWNGGLPDGYLLHGDGRPRQALVSRHLPLGILEPAAFSDRCEVYPLAEGDRIFLLSDGVLEACNQQGQLFGEERLLALLDANRQPQALFEEIQRALVEFRGEVQDDVSMLQVGLAEDDERPRPLAFADSGQSSSLDWSASFEFRAQSLRHFNPLPYLLQLLLDVQALRPRGGELYTVLAELYSNALEHGVMGLNSALKQDASGFAEYYRERRLRLAALHEGYVRFHLRMLPEDGGGRLIVRVEDSGPGFDPGRVMAAGDEALCGRGLALVRQLSDGFHVAPGGQGVSVEFCWSSEA
ncbi:MULTISPECIES: fused response regulator/phosphatase [Pseudomonadaceae]|jgi:CheY-like chemotaxis protein|uniref:Response regulator receiver protein n=2 Tax=Ectopseudomonas TaxID=3236654 RepID=A4XW58_ECTM1|nr:MULTISPECIES: fused response regulator/phosphatase [Pseudomonas]ARS49510.1 chemotaxis protein CheY [Pseudomonas mendocina]MBA4243180.1 fused response regulator/phosphatase [Pseudomonas sp.]MBF8164484.1 fused response regulator/phosphatase [Pseudomonas mendocina]MDH0095347.1 fused response regulator/phosphatase [Pseudomonas sp. GD04158]USR37975.1 fused response regulator/phosphatase [Pseudomonas hydrolytica]